MASVTSQLIEEVTAHAQSDSLQDAREICADGTYFPNNLRIYRVILSSLVISLSLQLPFAAYLMLSTFNTSHVMSDTHYGHAHGQFAISKLLTVLYNSTFLYCI